MYVKIILWASFINDDVLKSRNDILSNSVLNVILTLTLKLYIEPFQKFNLVNYDEISLFSFFSVVFTCLHFIDRGQIFGQLYTRKKVVCTLFPHSSGS